MQASASLRQNPGRYKDRQGPYPSLRNLLASCSPVSASITAAPPQHGRLASLLVKKFLLPEDDLKQFQIFCPKGLAGISS